jgi:2-haloacid dehalogenase
VPDAARFEVLTFDCYGTLIDWETGLLAALAPVFARHGVGLSGERTLEVFGALESEIEREPYQPYRDVLGRVLTRMGERLAFTPSPAEAARFADSVGDWPPFADSTAALHALGARHKLAIISNADDDLFARSARRLERTFDWIVTAQSVRAYKPSPVVFRAAFDRIAVPPARILHVAQSLYHDVAPARALGLATVWVNRRRGRPGFGATPPSDARPDFEVPDLESLVHVLGAA